MKVRRSIRFPHPRISYSTLEFSVELDSNELGVDVNDGSAEAVFEALMDRADKMLHKEIDKFIEGVKNGRD